MELGKLWRPRWYRANEPWVCSYLSCYVYPDSDLPFFVREERNSYYRFTLNTIANGGAAEALKSASVQKLAAASAPALRQFKQTICLGSGGPIGSGPGDRSRHCIREIAPSPATRPSELQRHPLLVSRLSHQTRDNCGCLELRSCNTEYCIPFFLRNNAEFRRRYTAPLGHGTAFQSL